jgi:hypothetical protein
VVAGIPREAAYYPVAVFKDKRPSLRWVPGQGLEEREARAKDEALQSFIASARCQAAVSAPPPSAYKVSAQTLSRNEPPGGLPGWTRGRADLVTGPRDRDTQNKPLGKNARRKAQRYGRS